METKKKYITPEAIGMEIVTESFVMQSSLEDYKNNPIFGAPGLDDISI